METIPVALTATGRCNSALGSYALPKTLLRIEVKGDKPDPTKAQTIISTLEELTIPDVRRTYCLDHLASASAADDISVLRGAPPGAPPLHRSAKTSTQLLTFISSHAIDYTADILRRIIRTIFIAVSGKPDFTPAARAAKANTPLTDFKFVLADYSFDPFDLDSVTRLNRDLKPLGFCVLLQSPYFDPARGAAEQYCAQPDKLLREGAQFSEAYRAYAEAQDLPASVPGIVYRPRLPYRLFVYANDDVTGGRTGWRLVRTMKVMLENASPVISVGVQRAIFAARRSALLFDRGTLIGLCVSKNSEMLAAMDIPLEVVRSIVALPSQILLIKYDTVTKTKDLLAAETALINLQKQYLDYLSKPDATKPNDGQQIDKTLGGYSGGPGAAFGQTDFASDADRVAPVFTSLNAICGEPTAEAKSGGQAG